MTIQILPATMFIVFAGTHWARQSLDSTVNVGLAGTTDLPAQKSGHFERLQHEVEILPCLLVRPGRPDAEGGRYKPR